MTLTRRNFLAATSAMPLLAAESEKRQLVIDAHCHAGHGVKLLKPWNTYEEVDSTLRNMNEAGIDRTIIFAIENPGYEKANEEIAEICGRHPTKFIGFARHDQDIEGALISRLFKREVQSLGLKGFKIIGTPPSRAALDVIAELGVPVLYHQDRVATFRTLAETYPTVPFLIAHLGSYNFRWDDHLESISLARQYPNIYLDTSTVALWQILETAVKEAGAAKLIFGSDGPEFDSRMALYRVKLLKLSSADEALVLGGNIRRLLPKGTLS